MVGHSWSPLTRQETCLVGCPQSSASSYFRAIELGLKAYLFARGQPADEVKAYGHDLDMLLRETHARGIDLVISLTGADMELVRTTGRYYRENKLGYFDMFFTLAGPKLPIAELAAVASRLLGALKQPCLDACDEPTWSPMGERGSKLA